MAKTRTFGVCLFQVLVILLLPLAKALWLELPSSETKCVSEDLHTNVVVLTDYFILPDEEFTKANVVPTMSISVTSPYGNNLHREENVTHGHFAFTAPEAGNYLACFWLASGSEVGKSATISIDWKTGFAAKDWDSVAKKENINGVELELKKLEGAVEAIRENLSYLKSREADMREVSERTNARVAWFSMMSLGVCIAVSLVQVWYLTRFFQKKKLI